MKILVLCFMLLVRFMLYGQSPGLSINITMDSVKAIDGRYKIEMKICKPKKMTERGDWFTHDTSTLDFSSLKSGDINCDEYFDNGMPTLISDKEEQQFNRFEFSGQVFAWEQIYVFRISNRGSRGWNPEMYIVIPMKYKSFVTRIKLTDLEFQSGKVIFLTDFNSERKGMYLNIEQSLENYKTVDQKTFPLRSVLEKE